MGIDIVTLAIVGVVAFLSGIGAVFVAVLLSPWLLRQKWLTWYRRWALHGVSRAVVDEVRALLLGEEAVPDAEKVEKFDWAQGKYVGTCACGCGMPIYYHGVGRQPKYLNQKHREFHFGRRLSPFG